MNIKGQRTMKIYRTMENGYHVHYSNKRDAVKGLKAALKAGDDYYTTCSEESEIEILEVPTDKKGLIKFLNEEANYTGFSPE